jgi:hypothetical protein
MDLLKIVIRAGARPSSGSCRTLGPIHSGPAAASACSPLILFCTYLPRKFTVNRAVLCCMSSGTGTLLMSSLMKMLLKLWFSRSAIALSSVTTLPLPYLTRPMDGLLFVLCFTYAKNGRLFPPFPDTSFFSYLRFPLCTRFHTFFLPSGILQWVDSPSLSFKAVSSCICFRVFLESSIPLCCYFFSSLWYMFFNEALCNPLLISFSCQPTHHSHCPLLDFFKAGLVCLSPG